ncbi:lytic transglycosylase domain-containing protein [uncultured Desulfovibrio sp.]|uniref:lytic transglycosylase domain-containing protein n=1 Tax=uncultured Desulfovibrio sp. TaxID=167968 RepID=UPI0026245CBB|nr:lytic transglycosylase domain-containing protein [uncultured Desulfovibrio sp.]
MKMPFFCLLLLLLSMPSICHARAKVSVPARANLTMECIESAAKRHGVPLAALLGILATEGGKPGQALRNTNGTWDLGPFQINICHVNSLLRRGISPEDVLADACVNADAAAWLLSQELDRSSTLWEAIGAYHSRTGHLHRAYIRRVRGNLVKLEQGRVAALVRFANGERRSW